MRSSLLHVASVFGSVFSLCRRPIVLYVTQAVLSGCLCVFKGSLRGVSFQSGGGGTGFRGRWWGSVGEEGFVGDWVSLLVPIFDYRM